MTAIRPLLADAPLQCVGRPSASLSGASGASKAPDSATRVMSTASSIRCPGCGMPSLRQIQRRSADRIVGKHVRLRRFECEDRYCQWSGNLTEHSGLAIPPEAMPVPRAPPGAMRSLVSVALSCVVGFGMILLLGHDFFPTVRSPDRLFTMRQIETSAAAHPIPEAPQALVYAPRVNSKALADAHPGSRQ